MLPLPVDAHGNVAFDAIVKQNKNSSKIVYSQHKDLLPKLMNDEKKKDEEEEEIANTTQRGLQR
ncbi:hypothetical protein AMTR_s00147p00080810 [Amborella trichopoda]|uniref:Uncharacterized protein n=1 Tax=Amborella trichopoda TaxID=13333 RepID=W1P8X2_AMBTC|nr:hypothetical protein AMTR_s00147p00080810 [Amborella trichopoda]